MSLLKGEAIFYILTYQHHNTAALEIWPDKKKKKGKGKDMHLRKMENALLWSTFSWPEVFTAPVTTDSLSDMLQVWCKKKPPQ